MRTPEDRQRVRSTVRMAAQMVAKGDPDTRMVSKIRIARLDAEGRPTGEISEYGPVLITWRLDRSA